MNRQATLTVTVEDAAGRAMSSLPIPFGPDSMVIGGDPASDIVVPGSPWPRLCEVSIQRRFGRSSIVARAGVEGLFGNRALLPVGEARPVGERLDLSAGTIRIVALAPSAPLPRPIKLAALSLAAGGALATLAALLSSAPPETPSIAAAAPRIEVAARRDSTEATVTRLLGAIDVASPVKVEQSAGIVVVSGSVTETEHARIVETLARGAAGSQPVRLDLEPAPVSRLIAAVSILPRRFVIGRDGRRYGVGETLGEGYRVERIDAERVTVSKDGLFESMPVNPQ